MKNQAQTPKPGSEAYNVEKPQDLAIPKFNSSTDNRSSHELPATENLNDQPETDADTRANDTPKTNLGNKRDDDEEEREKIITP